MSMDSLRRITTARELLAAGDIGRAELVRGRLRRMTPAGGEHGRVAMKIALRIGRFAEETGAGVVLAAETGFLLETGPDTVRAPDVAFLRRARASDARIRGFIPGAPDLAVEVLSPDDRPSEVQEKTREWLAAGALAVWIVDPDARTISLHAAGREPVTLGATDRLDGNDAVPGFAIPVAAAFAAD